MPGFELIVLAPLQQLFAEEVLEVDLQGAEGDLGVLAGHAPVIVMLRPGILTARGDGFEERFIVLGGIAEFSGAVLTVLADFASHIEEFDEDELLTAIDEMQQAVTELPVGEELDRTMTRLDQFTTLQASLALFRPV